MTKLLWLLALPACLPKTIDSDGPAASIRVEPTVGGSFTEGSIAPSMDRDTTSGNYDFTIQVDVDFGRTVTVGKEASEGSRYAVVNSFSGNVMPGGITFTDADFTVDTSFDDQHRREWMGKQPYTLPGSMMGQTAVFHLEAIDEKGLSSNVIDISAELR